MTVVDVLRNKPCPPIAVSDHNASNYASACWCRLQHHGAVGLDGELGGRAQFLGGLASSAPVSTTARHSVAEFRWRKGEFDRLVVGVEAQHERVVEHSLTARIEVGNAVAVEEHRDGFRETRAPVLVGHLGAVGGEPGDVGQPALAAAAHRLAAEEAAPAEHRVVGAQRRHRAGELQQAVVGAWTSRSR